MLNNTISITDMQAEALRLIELQQDIFHRILANSDVVSHSTISPQSPSDKSTEHFTEQAIKSKLAVLQENHTKLQNLDMVLAVVGTMKAGKSTSINAIVGREILPNRNRPMTALPTRIRHTRGQKTPVLQFAKCDPVNALMEELRTKAEKLKPETLQKLVAGDKHLAEALQMLRTTESAGQTHEGEEQIFRFLAYLNDLVRLSAALKVEFPFSEYTSIEDFPLIEVEFFHLAALDQVGMGRLTILDTPGFNEDGQQAKLLPMMRGQLEKATAVLAVLDYTQLNSESEGELREQLEAIASYAQGRMFSLVNKFDETDYKSTNAEETRDYVAQHLLKGAKIKPESIFPVSSRNAYLAKQAQLTVEQKGGIAWTEGQKESWIDLFGKLAFGEGFEQEDITSNSKVLRRAQTMWDKSLFDAPLTQVIQFGYLSAAHQAVNAAAHALKTHAEQLTPLIDGRLQMLKTDAPKLAKLMKEVNVQIDALAQVQSKAKKDLDSRIKQVQTAVSEGIQTANQDVQETMKEFLSKGSVQMASVLRGDLHEVLINFNFYKNFPTDQSNVLNALLEMLPPNLQAAQNILQAIRQQKKSKDFGEIKLFFSSPAEPTSETNSWPFTGSTVEALQKPLGNNIFATRGKNKALQNPIKVFDPEMVYDSREKAQKALADVGRQVQSILQGAQTMVTTKLEGAQATLAQSMQTLHQQVVEQITEFDTSAKTTGLDALAFTVPTLSQIKSSRRSLTMTDNLIDDQSRTVIKLREQSGVWGLFKRTVDVFGAEWGHDDIQVTDNRFVIKMKDMQAHWNTVVNNELETLGNSVQVEFSGPVQERAKEFFEGLKTHFEGIAENLQGGLENHQQSKAQQIIIQRSLEELQKMHKPSLQDLSSLVDATQKALQQLQCEVTAVRAEWIN